MLRSSDVFVWRLLIFCGSNAKFGVNSLSTGIAFLSRFSLTLAVNGEIIRFLNLPVDGGAAGAICFAAS
jgi:hypothetical protein